MTIVSPEDDLLDQLYKECYALIEDALRQYILLYRKAPAYISIYVDHESNTFRVIASEQKKNDAFHSTKLVADKEIVDRVLNGTF